MLLNKPYQIDTPQTDLRNKKKLAIRMTLNDHASATFGFIKRKFIPFSITQRATFPLRTKDSIA